MKVWMLVDLIQDGARYYEGSSVNLPDEKIASLAAYGIVSITKPDGIIT